MEHHPFGGRWRITRCKGWMRCRERQSWTGPRLLVVGLTGWGFQWLIACRDKWMPFMQVDGLGAGSRAANGNKIEKSGFGPASLSRAHDSSAEKCVWAIAASRPGTASSRDTGEV